MEVRDVKEKISEEKKSVSKESIKGKEWEHGKEVRWGGEEGWRIEEAGGTCFFFFDIFIGV